MKKFLGILASLLLLLGLSSFLVIRSQGYQEKEIFIYGQNDYEKNGIISIASTDEPVINISAFGLEGGVDLEVYLADMDDVLNFLIHNSKGEQTNPKVNLDKFSKVASIKGTIKGRVSLPLEGTGVWLVHGEKDGVTVDTFIVRSSMAVVAKESDNEFLFWVQSFSDKRSVSGVKLRVYSLEDEVKEHHEKTTDYQGIAKTAISTKYDVAVIGHDRDKALVPLNLRYLNYGSNFSRFKEKSINSDFFIFTDRPIYQPGDTIFFKAIIREDDDVRFTIPRGEIIAELAKGYGDSKIVVDAKRLEISSFGAVDGKFEIPENIKTGSYLYRLEIRRADVGAEDFYGSSSVSVSIEHYRKPEFGLDLYPDKQEIIAGEEVSFNIQGKYFSGQPVSKREVTYTVEAADFHEYGYLDDFNLYASWLKRGSWGYYQCQKIEGGKVILDENGNAIINIKPKIQDGKSKIYSVEVHLSGIGGDATETKNILVRPGQFGIFRKDRNYGVRVGDSADISFVINSDDGSSVDSRELNVEIHRDWWEKVEDSSKEYGYRYLEKSEYLKNEKIKTDSQGEALLSFNAPKGGSYNLIVKGIDEKGNEIKKEFHVWANDSSEYYYNGTDEGGITLSLDKDEYNPGEAAKVSISLEQENKDVLLTFERGRVRRYRVVSINGRDAVFEEKMEDSDVPNIFVVASSFSDNRLSRSSYDAGVSAKGKELSVSLIPNKEKYGPGEEVEIDLRVTDREGVPQVAEVTLWAVDKAIFELVDPKENDVFEFFWKKRYNSVQTSHSLEGISISMAEMGGCFADETEVLMSDGQTKKIEQVKKGDSILTRSSEDDGKLISSKVLGLHQAEVGGVLIINNELRLTGNHIVWVNDGWRRADEIQIGDYLINNSGSATEVDSLEWEKGSTLVYNLEVEKYHSFFADGVWVHNGKDGGTRTVFADTAYWNPRIRTNSNGYARVSFTVPDNLTTWVVSALGATKETVVGKTASEIVVSKDTIIRPFMPNVLYEGDKISLGALAQNFTEEERTFIANLEFDSGEVENSEKEIILSSKGSEQLEWMVRPKQENENATITFSLIAKNNQDNQDRVVINLPVRKIGYWENNSIVSDGQSIYPLSVFDDARNDKTKIELNLSSTLVGSLSSAVKYLIEYPYGCVEQTTSRFAPAVMAKENPIIFKEALSDRDLDEILKEGVDKLAKLQNQDGGWTWWSGDRSDPFVTAYVTEYLLRAKAAGVLVDEKILEQDRNYFKNEWRDKTAELMNGQEWEIIRYYGQTLLGSERDMNQIDLSNSDVPSDILALGVIANIRNGQLDPRTNGVNKLKMQSIQEGNHSFWKAGLNNRFGSDHASTGLALRALLLSGVKADEISGAIRYLIQTKKRNYWSNTFATVQTVQSLVDYSKKESERRSSLDYEVFVGGRSLASGKLDDVNFSDVIDIPLDKIEANESDVIVKTSGSSTFYSDLVTRQYRVNHDAQKVTRGLSVDRRYSNAKGEGYNIAVGDVVNVDLTVTGLLEDANFLVLEDQLPSGLVPINSSLNNNISNSSSIGDMFSYRGYSKEYTSNGIIFSDENIYGAPKVYSYQARVVSSGDFYVPPATVSLMYSPEIYGNSGVARMKVDVESKKSVNLGDLGDSQKFKVLAGMIIIMLLLLIIPGIIIYFRIRNRGSLS